MSINLSQGESATVQYHTSHGVKPAYVICQRKFLWVITQEPDLKLARRVPKSEMRFMKPLDIKPSRWRSLARRAGTSIRVRRALGVVK